MLPLSQFKKLDVRPLLKKGVDPFGSIRKRIDSLKKDEGLMIIAPFLPSPLIEKLESEGFSSKLERGHAADWVVYFWKEEPANE
jgi:hypothetical protein